MEYPLPPKPYDLENLKGMSVAARDAVRRLFEASALPPQDGPDTAAEAMAPPPLPPETAGVEPPPPVKTGWRATIAAAFERLGEDMSRNPNRYL